jgi:membrane protease YdiL (CAAX protease family)
VAFAFLGALGAVWLYSLLISVADLGFLEPDRQIETDYYDNAAVIAALGISIVAGAPFAEELLFRGFFYAGLRRYMGVALAAVVSGSIFALAHQDVGLILPFTAVAVIFAVTYERTGSLLPSIGGHLLFNLLSFSILILVPDAR